MAQQSVTVPMTRVLEAVRAGRGRRGGPLLLELDLTGGLLPAQPPDVAGRLQSRGTPTLPGVVRALAEAADDPQVHGLLAKIGGTGPRPAAAPGLPVAPPGPRPPATRPA